MSESLHFKKKDGNEQGPVREQLLHWGQEVTYFDFPFAFTGTSMREK